MSSIKFPFSQELKTIFDLLNKNDSIRIVGGCVRDFLIKKEIHDIDLACKYTPEKSTLLLSKNPQIKIIPTGIKHGTITAILNNKSFEITTLRSDVKTHGRHAEVKFIDNFKHDAKRRDFTINAMSIDADGSLFDYFGGLDDLNNKKVKFIGDAQLRIKEDYLRILRFFRFSCYYSEEIDKEALEEIVQLKDQLSTLSSHRIRSELLKTIQCNNHHHLLQILEVMSKRKILQEILPLHDPDLSFLANLFKLSQSINQEQNYILRFCALIYSHRDQNKKITELLDFSNKDKKYICDIFNLSQIIDLDIDKTNLLKTLFDHDKQLVLDALIINTISKLNDRSHSTKKFLQIQSIITITKLPKFILNGNDLIDCNIEDKKIGILLKHSRNHWIESEFKLSKSDLLSFINKINN